MNSTILIRLGMILIASLFFSNCKEDEKKPSGGSAPGGQAPLDSGSATGGGSGSGGSGSAPVSGPAKTKAECNGENNSWIAVVNGGPATCGAPLSAWGCCKASIVGRFPTLAQDIATQIDKNVSDGFQLYNCSSSGDKDHKVHFAKFPGGGRTEYRELSIPAFAFNPQKEDGCPKIPEVNFPDPAQYAGPSSSGATSSASTGSSSSSSSTGGSGTNLTFDRDINPIIKRECANTGCHGSAGAGAAVYENNESAFKGAASAVKDRIARAQGTAGVMPPTRAISGADRRAILEFLGN